MFESEHTLFDFLRLKHKKLNLKAVAAISLIFGSFKT